MDDTPAETTSATDLETTLLLANISTALRDLEKPGESDDPQTLLRRLEAALHTYGSVKHLLPKLNLNAQQRAMIEQQLHELRSRIVARS